MLASKCSHFLLHVLKHEPKAAEISLQASAETLQASLSMHAAWINFATNACRPLDALICFCGPLVHVPKAAKVFSQASAESLNDPQGMHMVRTNLASISLRPSEAFIFSCIGLHMCLRLLKFACGLPRKKNKNKKNNNF